MTLEDAIKMARFYQENIGKYLEKELYEIQKKADSFDEFLLILSKKERLKSNETSGCRNEVN